MVATGRYGHSEAVMTRAAVSPFSARPARPDRARTTRHRWLTVPLWLGMGLGLGSAGCRDDAAAQPEAGSGDDGEQDVGEDEGDPSALCEERSVAHTPMRRLTRLEYDNSVRDLLGDATRPAEAFLPDDDANGFDANAVTPITQAQVEKYGDAAEALAADALTRLDSILPCDPAADETGCAAQFIDQWVTAAYRRPLSDEERSDLLALYEQRRAVSDFDQGIALVIEAALQSPNFLYRAELGDPAEDAPEGMVALGDYEVAARLSYFLWATTPDEELLTAAAAGELSTPDQVADQARRMLEDDRLVEAVVSLHDQWLEFEQLPTISKNAEVFPEFTPELSASMRTEAELFVADVIGGDTPTLGNLLTASYTFADAGLQALYGQSGGGAEFERIELSAEQRAGILTLPGLLAVQSHEVDSSPVFRGELIRRELLCQPPPPPPPDVNDSVPEGEPGQTARERLEAHSADPVCSGCHNLMDPIGFGFEHYDAIGRWRTEADGVAVDAQGELFATEDIDGEFEGAIELAERLSGSEQVRVCVARKWFRFALGRAEDSTLDACSMDVIDTAFAESDYDLRELAVAIVVSDAFRFIPAV